MSTLSASSLSDLPAARAERRAASPFSGFFSVTWAAARYLLLNPATLGFSLALPLLMYFMFGVGRDYSSISVGNANAAASVLQGMTLYGAVMVTASAAASVSLERTQGITRLFALTPLSTTAYVWSRIAASLVVALVAVTVTYLVGAFTGAAMTVGAWITSALFILASTILSSALGLAAGFSVRSDAAYSVCSAVVVLSSFAAGMFVPLDQMPQFFQDIAPWTPFSGISHLSALPLVQWEGFSWSAVANVVVWIAASAGLAMWGARRDTRR